MDKITCSSCQSKCVPKLWHYQPMPGAFRSMATQHICPFCGDVMYESGGRMNVLGWIAVAILGVVITLGLLDELRKATDGLKVVGIIGSLCFWGFIGLKLFKRKKR